MGLARMRVVLEIDGGRSSGGLSAFFCGWRDVV
jgi:hypothetical protein